MSISSILDEIINPPSDHSAVTGAVDLRASPDDFEVEERPVYPPSGDGEHLFLWIEKRNLTTAEMVSAIARNLKLKPRDIGVAGQKDRRAVTRQFISVPRSVEANLKRIDDQRFRILSAVPHGNKLRTGHLRGNGFRIVLRPLQQSHFSDSDAALILSRLTDLQSHGFPNYYGPQRFGNTSASLERGIELLRAGSSSVGKSRRRSRSAARFEASIVQSAVFNLVLAARVREGTHRVPQTGDVVCRRDGIKPFLFADDGATPLEDLVPMGPMPGPKMQPARDVPAAIEEAVMERLQLATANFAAAAKLTPGTRRKMVVSPSETSIALLPDGAIEVRFDLPAGSFATILLGEICESTDGRDKRVPA